MFEQHLGLESFVWEHRDDDPSLLALSAQKYPDIPVHIAAAQIAALQKIKRKIPAWYQPGLWYPSPLSIEQASSERSAQFKSSLIQGQHIADLSGGLGVDDFFFAQRFSQVVHVEQNTELQAAVRRNFSRLQVHNVLFYAGTAEDFLQHNTSIFDCIYLDPARRHDTKGKVLRLEDCSPNILEIKDLIFQHARQILIKTAPMLDISLAIRQLGQVSEVWVVSVDDECREVLYRMDLDAPSSAQVALHAVSIGKDQPMMMDTTSLAQEATTPAPVISPPLGWLYEPHAALMKLGAFHVFAERYGLKKLHPFTHLFTADAWLPDVPGRSFVIEKIHKYDRKSVAAALPEGRANVAVRNFPDTAEAVRQRLGLRDGGDTYLFGVTDWKNAKVLLQCRKVER
jgi:16S rRNA G966 N2-methylase RsmD